MKKITFMLIMTNILNLIFTAALFDGIMLHLGAIERKLHIAIVEEKRKG